ncbi:type IV toxin-antitoxin system AbiEi family antitoxin domain-containing protein [Streptosporangium sp. NBC_01469]|uniref:type IV toxin-antitoxin system AbiEi family antitoxin domain-containing protein n=1 Tax=Streptosporangium sp. NBC_01469 TaxID=2903898 RepID=UPI002E288FC3|nr:type IV toxin-antitoxin system AbiEi family antitoxin domain-containing protein [Streptosporangium sp. NBC_01469]
MGESAADQWGLVTAAQAKSAGLSAVDLLRLAEAGFLESVGRGVYLVTGAVQPEHLDIKVAWLRLEPKLPAWQRHDLETYGGVISHGSACELHQLGDLPTSLVEISVPRRRTTREHGVRMHRAELESADVVLVDGLPVTTAERTVVDLLAARVDGAHAGGVIADADRYGLTNRDSLSRRVARFTAAYGLPRSASGRQLLEYLVEQAGTGLPMEEVARLRQEGVAEGFVSALALLSKLDEDRIKQIFADRPNPLADLQAESVSSFAERLAKSGAIPLSAIIHQASQASRLAGRLPPAAKVNPGSADFSTQESITKSSDRTSPGEAQ